jgi:hypothetical protein
MLWAKYFPLKCASLWTISHKSLIFHRLSSNSALTCSFSSFCVRNKICIKLMYYLIYTSFKAEDKALRFLFSIWHLTSDSCDVSFQRQNLFYLNCRNSLFIPWWRRKKCKNFKSISFAVFKFQYRLM